MLDMNLLAKVPFFAPLSPDQLAELATKLTTRDYRRGEVIFHQGDPGSVLYIIKTGQVKISANSADGGEVILAILTDDDIFGELSLLDGGDRSATATAMQPTQTLSLQRDAFLDTLATNRGLVSYILALLTHRLRRSDLLLQDAIFLNLPARLAKRLLELSQTHGRETEEGIIIDLRVTQQDLSDSVGASRVAVNKQLGLYQAKGVIRISRQKITIIRPEELKKLI
ncbi:MAG: Crp/Fnr family transcriptional regulator [Dehalococcoidia bacterium]|nr:Crp/Fnr family transcriptional regulator [Dehalococcoidia bacterium]